MPTFIEAMPTFINENEQKCFYMKPSGEMNGEYMDGYVRSEWFSTVFPNIANDELPLSKDNYDSLKNIDQFWKVNAINWRKDSVIEVDGIAADEQIEEEEAFLLEMYPPAPEEPTETPEEPTEGETTPEEETVPTEPETAPAETTEETTEEA